ncbi:hypothetical protein IG631_19851 [Alternaria alternata]|nr:hypothetical protein IG631_19851 [Alternaria alternata]
MTSDENNVSGNLVQVLDCAPRILTPSCGMHDIPRKSEVRKTVFIKPPPVSASLDYYISFLHLRLETRFPNRTLWISPTSTCFPLPELDADWANAIAEGQRLCVVLMLPTKAQAGCGKTLQIRLPYRLGSLITG